MRRVILESPFAGASPDETARNIGYARAALRDSLLRGEAPLASHLLYTQPGVLDDTIPDERRLGIEAGLAWGPQAAASVVYADLGITRGMHQGIDRAGREGRQVERRLLGIGPREPVAAPAFPPAGAEHRASLYEAALRRIDAFCRSAPGVPQEIVETVQDALATPAEPDGWEGAS